MNNFKNNSKILALFAISVLVATSTMSTAYAEEEPEEFEIDNLTGSLKSSTFPGCPETNQTPNYSNVAQIAFKASQLNVANGATIYVRITDTSGNTVLSNTVSTTSVSGGNIACTQFSGLGGIITSAASGGAKLWISTSSSFPQSDSKTDNITLNIQNPTIQISKTCVGGTGATFGFTIAGPSASSPNVACGASSSSISVTSGTYSVTETTIPANWAPSGVSCTKNGSASSNSGVSLTFGDSLQCTFTNTFTPPPTGSIVIAKVCEGGSGPTFGFTIAGPSASTPSLACGASTSPITVNSGQYTITENTPLPAGWQQKSGSPVCTIGANPASNVNQQVNGGETLTCTFTNQKIPTLTVNKILNPSADPGLFNLRIDGSTAGTGANVGNGGTTGSVEVSIGSHTVSETAGTGTNLSNYQQTIGGDCAANGSVSLAAGENKVCTITNDRKPTITITKVSNGGVGQFDFAIAGPTGSTPSITTASGSSNSTSTEVNMGSYSVAETGMPANWQYVSGNCELNGFSVGSPINQGFENIVLGAGDNLTCTFTNDKMPTVQIVKVSQKGTDTFGFTITNGTGAPLTPSITTASGFNNSTAATPVHTGTYSVTENTLPGNWLFVSASCVGGTNNGSPVAMGVNGIILGAGDNLVCTFTNNLPQPVRSQGFWSTHHQFAMGAWNHATAIPPGDKMICGKNVNTAEKMEGGFWSSISKRTVAPTQRSALDQAKMQLVQQYLAAVFNKNILGANDNGAISAAQTACLSNNIGSIQSSKNALEAFNTGPGELDPLPNPLPFGLQNNQVSGSYAKSQANIGEWNNIP